MTDGILVRRQKVGIILKRPAPGDILELCEREAPITKSYARLVDWLIKAKRFDEVEREVGEVVHAVHPLRELGATEAGEGGGEDLEACREAVVKRLEAIPAVGSVKDEQRGTVSRHPGVEPDAVHHEKFLPPLLRHQDCPFRKSMAS